MNLPSWTMTWLGTAAFVHLAAFMVCDFTDTGSPTDSSGNVFEQVQAFMTFESCTGLPAFFTWSLFALFTLPGLLILAAFVFDLFENDVTGAVVGVGVLLTGLIALIGV